MKRRFLWAATALVALLLATAAPTGATQLGSDAVYINPGGGLETDGTDGLLIAFNTNSDPVISGGANTVGGSDALAFMNTTQYCCGGSSPMLNIGGTLYGTAGAASGASTTNVTFEIVSLTGTAATAASTTTGSGSAVMRTTITHGGLDYVITRTATYQYPSASFLDAYEIVIPAGNTDVVKFYLGGDTAPGTSDVGTGVEVTDPVRTIYSVNPSSEIQLGFGEVVGDEPFDGALIGHYSAPYSTIAAGGDIGFSVNTSSHDAGIMIQWDLGSTPGTFDRSLRHFVGARGASLSAQLTDTEIESGESSRLDLTVLNTGSSDATGVGFVHDLPAGVTIDGTVDSTCGGTLVAPDGGSSIDLSGFTVTAAGSCLVQVPITAGGGTYEFTSALVTSITDIENAVGSQTLTVNGPVDEPVTPPAPACDRRLLGTYTAATDIEGMVGRLYMATFNRQPDPNGFAFWTDALETGSWTIDRAATFFVSSPEWNATYGPLDEGDFLDTLYNNVMCRDADAGGRTFWLQQMNRQMTRAWVMLHFSQSPEFKDLTESS